MADEAVALFKTFYSRENNRGVSVDVITEVLTVVNEAVLIM